MTITRFIKKCASWFSFLFVLGGGYPSPGENDDALPFGVALIIFSIELALLMLGVLVVLSLLRII